VLSNKNDDRYITFSPIDPFVRVLGLERILTFESATGGHLQAMKDGKALDKSVVNYFELYPSKGGHPWPL
jgi:hypothetical protein